jgi:hypothetical protein
MSKLDVLRKIIREEVRGVIREELSHILKENINNNSSIKHINNSTKHQLSKSIKSKIEETSDPIMDILNETRMNMTGDDYRTIMNADSNMAQGFGQYSMSTNTQPTVVESVDQMLANAKPAGDLSQVKIDSVPDFSALMKTMKNNGQI